MTSQYVWVGIAVGVFFTGLGIGYAVFLANQPTANFMHMSPQQMQQMMNNPQMMIRASNHDEQSSGYEHLDEYYDVRSVNNATNA